MQDAIVAAKMADDAKALSENETALSEHALKESQFHATAVLVRLITGDKVAVASEVSSVYN